MVVIWTEDDYDSLDWHDVHVHAFRIVGGEHGAGELWFDLDYIVEWLCSNDGSCRFRVAPAVLVFREATSLRVAVDYEGPTAALGPFSLDSIERETRSYGAGVETNRWMLRVNWPIGEITFESPGFEQRLTGAEIETDSQYLEASQRSCGFSGTQVGGCFKLSIEAPGRLSTY